MGTTLTELTITASLPDHRDEPEEIQLAEAWGKFIGEVKALAEKPEYDGLQILVFG